METENKTKTYEGFNSDMTDVPEKSIDWEQRRFEIAKDIYVRVVNDPHIWNDGLKAYHCVEYADNLINVLKNSAMK